jgi:predicted metal-dependent hydrolase
MKKTDRISAFVASLGADSDAALDPRYTGYFTCFNTQQYYEAHDVLEDLWLQTRGGDHLFFKGLIQFAGAFVHLQKQAQHPTHPKHGRRLRPAERLFQLALRNLEPYTPRHQHLDVAEICALCRATMAALAATAYAQNPWQPEHAPHLHLLPAS